MVLESDVTIDRLKREMKMTIVRPPTPIARNALDTPILATAPPLSVAEPNPSSRGPLRNLCEASL